MILPFTFTFFVKSILLTWGFYLKHLPCSQFGEYHIIITDGNKPLHPLYCEMLLQPCSFSSGFFFLSQHGKNVWAIGTTLWLWSSQAWMSKSNMSKAGQCWQRANMLSQLSWDKRTRRWKKYELLKKIKVFLFPGTWAGVRGRADEIWITQSTQRRRERAEKETNTNCSASKRHVTCNTAALVPSVTVYLCVE